MKRLTPFATTLLLLVSWPASAEVVRVSIATRVVVAGGQAFGTTGAYEKLTGTIEFALDPGDRHNRGIVDLALAPRAADGRVHFSSDLYVLRPVDRSLGNGALLFEISNRGGKGLLSRFNRARGMPDPTQPADFGDGFLMREGYTLVWVGWEFDIAPGAGTAPSGAPGPLRIEAPPVALPAGIPVAPISVHFTVDAKATGVTPLRDAPQYPPADIADVTATLTVRDHFWDRPTVVSRDRWRFVAAAAPTLMLDGGFEPGRIYDVTYTASGARVAGVGLAAIRDAASAFRYRSDLPVHGTSTMAYGSSQSGRFLRQFLYDGFNADERDRRVFDAVWPHIAGAARGSFNERFAMPTSLSAFAGTRPPFIDGSPAGTGSRPASQRAGATGGLLMTYRPDQLPKIFYTNTSVEYWGNGRAAALTHTSADGRADIALPDNIRVYLLAGTQHGEAPFPPSTTVGQQPANPVPQANVMRALLRALHQWISTGAVPPASRYPRLGDGTLTPVADLRFPSIPGVRDPRRITGPALTKADGSVQPLPFLVPQVDGDGNELAGIRVPDVAVPLATTTGWNFRAESVGNPGEIYSLLGSYVALPATKESREARRDPRRSIEERYTDRDAYLEQIQDAALALVRGRYLLEGDMDDVMRRAAGHWDQATRRPVTVVLETEAGSITIEVDAQRAPVTAANFLKYVDAGLYDGGRFHRTVRPDTESRTDYPIQVIQASRREGSGGAEGFPPIALERTSVTGITHRDGVVSMARVGPDSATSDFFICVGDQPELDFGGRRNADGQGFAAFGRVVSGMEVVRRIQTSAVRTGTQNLAPPVTILKAARK